MIILGFDPGKDKCGIALMNNTQLLDHRVVAAGEAIAILQSLVKQYQPSVLVMGDQTTAKLWQNQLAASSLNVPIVLVDERNSTLEARERYWQMYPPSGINLLIPKGMRFPPRPVDDVVAILLIERYLAKNQL